jgi:hypothetical protein
MENVSLNKNGRLREQSHPPTGNSQSNRKDAAALRRVKRKRQDDAQRPGRSAARAAACRRWSSARPDRRRIAAISADDGATPWPGGHLGPRLRSEPIGVSARSFPSAPERRVPLALTPRWGRATTRHLRPTQPTGDWAKGLSMNLPSFKEDAISKVPALARRQNLGADETPWPGGHLGPRLRSEPIGVSAQSFPTASESRAPLALTPRWGRATTRHLRPTQPTGDWAKGLSMNLPSFKEDAISKVPALARRQNLGADETPWPGGHLGPRLRSEPIGVSARSFPSAPESRAPLALTPRWGRATTRHLRPTQPTGDWSNPLTCPDEFEQKAFP